ncbi:invasion associated locus B family protein [Acidimangrovimonas sediminis]|uniref:invasion associated locus B family protein n=1 Tax=Acidimangrovimonas sediminis TaxID=2056283 RepID=UPI000C80BD5B|nr:invasion associated locus B family protein [Acidimangrovimonas sediminis]
MTPTKARAMIGALAAMAMIAPATGAMAQETKNRVAVKTDWSVFTEGNPKECWGVSSPKSSVITENGKKVSAQRGDILLFVTYRPGHDGKGEVSFTGGYPFAKDSTADLVIGSDKFTMITDGEWAWPAKPEDDQKVIDAMKGGADAVITAHSSRGKETKDTFSLLGFTAATEDAATRCK